MYAYSVIAYGFDFSDGKHPILEGYEIPELMYDYINEGDLLDTHYSGISRPYYIGTRLCDINPIELRGECIISLIDDVKNKVQNNKEYYNDRIIKKIDNIIGDIETNAKDYVDDYGYTQDDISKTIDYFKKLKTVEPSCITILATS